MAINNSDKIYYKYKRDNKLIKSEYIHLSDYQTLSSVSLFRKNGSSLIIKMNENYSTSLRYAIANIVDNIQQYTSEEINNKINLLLIEG